LAAGQGAKIADICGWVWASSATPEASLSNDEYRIFQKKTKKIKNNFCRSDAFLT